VNLKLDRDFTLQVLSLGYDTLRTFKYAFSCPKNGSNAGGLQGVYQTDGEELRNSQRMCELWGAQVCKLNIKSDGRPDVKINWGYFKSCEQDERHIESCPLCGSFSSAASSEFCVQPNIVSRQSQ
jgi:hypothetical protein